MGRKSWTIDQLKVAVQTSTSIRQILKKIGLREAGGNYKQISKYISEYEIDNSHFKGRGWNKGNKHAFRPRKKLKDILVKNSNYQSYKLKKRLFRAKIKKQECEACGWAKQSEDGRIPLELDHINGDSKDNRLKNLQVLCPNCHSLRPTHRGRNKRRASGGIGRRARLKSV